METPISKPEGKTGGTRWALSLAALGVVFGDIGTSPLYAVRECFFGDYAISMNHDNILGVLSLMFWSLILVVTVKYLTFIMRADNDGEGGVIALTSLLKRSLENRGRSRVLLIGIGLFAASLLYGDGMITPAISVMSALEGLDVLTPAFKPYIIPATIVILGALFLLQHRGTARVGAMFGPVVLLWLTVIRVLGGVHVFQNLSVLKAMLPHYGLHFLLNNHLHGFLVLGAVFLVVTGTEALYADMGHFGHSAIRRPWLMAVLPALLLNYFGQGALLLAHPEAARNPFYAMAPSWTLIPILILATMATIIASQAVITGSFSLTKQAIQLGYLPRLRIVHTSSTHIGQIYVPMVNWLLIIATIGLVLGFQSSSKLAAAYGVAVTSTMTVTSILFYFVARNKWGWPRFWTLLLLAVFLTVDLSFFFANITKIMHGAWFPLAIGFLVFILLTTWHKGRKILSAQLKDKAVTLDRFREMLDSMDAARVRGTALFLAGTRDLVPSALLHNLKHNRVVHQQVILLHFMTENVPRVPNSDKVELRRLGGGFNHVVIRYGFMEELSFDNLLALIDGQGLDVDPETVSVFMGRQRLVVGKTPGMARWRKHLFIRLSGVAQDAALFFRIPMEKVIEVGVPLEL